MFDLYIVEAKAICCFKIFHMKRREPRWGWSVFNQGAIGESVGSHAVTIKISRSKWNECSSKIQIRSSNQDNPTIPQTVCLEFLYPGLCATFVYNLCFYPRTPPRFHRISLCQFSRTWRNLPRTREKHQSPLRPASLRWHRWTRSYATIQNGHFGCCWEVLHFKYQQFFLAFLGVVSLNCNKTDPPGRRPCHAS